MTQAMVSTSTASVNIFFFIAIGICVILISTFLITGTRHYLIRRRRRELLGQHMENLHGEDVHGRRMTGIYGMGYGPGFGGIYPYSIGTNGPRREHEPRNRKIPKLMTREQIDQQFPAKRFEKARQESPLYVKQCEKGGAEKKQSKVVKSNQVGADDTASFNAPSFQQQASKNEKSLEHQHFASMRQNFDSNSDRLNNGSVSQRNSMQEFTRHSIDEFQGGRGDYSKFMYQSNHVRYSTPALTTENRVPLSRHSMEASVNDVTQPKQQAFNSHNFDETDLLTCPICIDDMTDDSMVRGLACGHIFHTECIEPWLLTRRACCPLCKQDYYAPNTIDPLGPNPINDIMEPENAELRNDRDLERGNEEGQGELRLAREGEELEDRHGRLEPSLNRFRSSRALASSMFSRTRLFGRRDSSNNNNSNDNNASSNVSPNGSNINEPHDTNDIIRDNNNVDPPNATTTVEAQQITTNTTTTTNNNNNASSNTYVTPRQLEEGPRYPEAIALR